MRSIHRSIALSGIGVALATGVMLMQREPPRHVRKHFARQNKIVHPAADGMMARAEAKRLRKQEHRKAIAARGV